MIQEFLILELNTDGWRAEALVNDVPVSRVGAGTALLDSRPVNQFVVPGRNVLSVVVEPGPTPSRWRERGEERAGPGQGKVSLKLSSMPRGSFPEEPGVRVLARTEWSLTTPAFRPPVVQSIEVDLPEAKNRWSWLDAAAISVSDGLVHAVAGFLRELSDACNRGDPEPFIARAGARFAENAAAYQTDVAEDIRNFREQFRRLSAEPDFRMEPAREETMDLRICGDGRLIDCLDRSWEPVLRSVKRENGVTRLRYPVKLAVLHGALEIVR